VKFIKLFFGGKFGSPGPAIQPIFNKSGVLLCTMQADGGMGMVQVDVPSTWQAAEEGSGRFWYVGQPLTLELFDGAVVVRKGGELVRIFDGRENDAQARALLVLMRQRWLEANSETLGGLANTAGASKPLVLGQGTRSPWIRRLGYVFGFAGVFAAGLGAMHYYLHPGGVGLDLSGMSIEEVAKIDSNPAIIREVQDQMMAAVGVGQERAKNISGAIEKDHIAALKAMGLNTGVSMKNALNCLAQK